MRKLNIWAGVILLVTLLMISLLVYAKLSDDTLELVDDLRWKHYPFFYYDGDIEWTYDYLNISFDDETGILYVETQDGKWFIKMTKMEE